MITVTLYVLLAAFVVASYVMAAIALWHTRNKNWFEWTTAAIAPLTIIFFFLELIYVLIKQFIASKRDCEHRFKSKRVTDLNLSLEELECEKCKKNFQQLSAKHRLRFIDLGTGFHTVVKIKTVLLFMLCVSCGGPDPEPEQTPTQLIVYPCSGQKPIVFDSITEWYTGVQSAYIQFKCPKGKFRFYGSFIVKE
jgi:hypothetical protein